MKDKAEKTITPLPKTEAQTARTTTTNNVSRPSEWPVVHDRQRVPWFPASHRLISLVRGNRDSYVLPPAVVRKASWRD